MKKFIIFVMILIVTVSLGVTVFYFAQDKEELIVNSNAEIFVNQGDTVKFDVELKYAKSGHKIVMESLNPDVLSSNGDVLSMGFDAANGGAAIVQIYVSNNKKIEPIYVTVNVGNGNPSTPFYVDSEETLKTIAQTSDVAGKNYLLLNDISLNEAFTPLNEFNGTFNGNGFTISNLTIASGNATNATFGGLFSKIGTNGVVTNLNIKSVNINGQFSSVGAIAAENEGTISRCSVTDGLVVSTLNDANVGGIVGVNRYSSTSKGRVDRSYTSINVKGTKNVGGIAGQNIGGIIINSYAVGNENISVLGTSEGAVVGGIVGFNTYVDNNAATIKNCYANINVKKDENLSESQATLGALVGLNTDKTDQDLNRLMGNYYLADFGLAGVNHSVNPSFSNDDTGKAKKANYRGIYEFPKDGSNNVIKEELYSYYSSEDLTSMVKWDFVNVWRLSATENSGYPTLNINGSDVPDDLAFLYDPSLINNASALLDFVNKVNSGALDSNSYYRVTDSITLTGDFTPIGTRENPFSGTFDGGGYTITGLKVNSTTATNVVYAGLFGYVSNSARIINIKLIDPMIESGAEYAGALVGYSEGATISNCEVNVTTNSTTPRVSAKKAAGGVAGVSEGIIENCTISNLVVRTMKIINPSSEYDKFSYAGGIAGQNGIINSSKNATISNCVVNNCNIFNDYGTEHGYDQNSYKLGSAAGAFFNNPAFYDIQSPYIHVGGIAGASNYKITNSKVVNSTLKADATDKATLSAGITAYSKSLLRSKTDPELYLNAVYNTDIVGFTAVGVVGVLYGTCDQNACIGGKAYGFVSSGLAGDVAIGASITNGLIGDLNLSHYEGHNQAVSCGLFVQTHYENKDSMGTVYNCFTYARFTSEGTNYYDSACAYRLHTILGIGDDYRKYGKGDNLIYVETGNAKNNIDMAYGSVSDCKNVMGISETDAKMDLNGIKEKFQNYSFDIVEIWEFEVNSYPTLKNIPQNN